MTCFKVDDAEQQIEGYWAMTSRDGGVVAGSIP